MVEVQLFYRDGDVGDGPRWEASVSDVDGAGATPAEALEALNVALYEREPEPDVVVQPVDLAALAAALNVDVATLEDLAARGAAPASPPAAETFDGLEVHNAAQAAAIETPTVVPVVPGLPPHRLP